MIFKTTDYNFFVIFRIFLRTVLSSSFFDPQKTFKNCLKKPKKIIVYSFKNHNFLNLFGRYLYDFCLFLRLLNLIVYFETKVTSVWGSTSNIAYDVYVVCYGHMVLKCLLKNFFIGHWIVEYKTLLKCNSKSNLLLSHTAM